MSYLEVSNLTRVINKTTILNDISFTLEKGELLVILGSSGCGKTTLLRNLNLLDFAEAGKIIIDNQVMYDANEKKIKAKELQERHKLIGLVFQSFNLFPHYNVKDNVTLALKLENKLQPEEIEAKAIHALESVGLKAKLNAYPYQLSGGQQQRVAIARSLVLSPKVLCFDEPTSALDPALTREVIKVIQDLKAHQQTMIVVTHELGLAREIADKIIFMKDGIIIEEGTVEDIFTNPQQEETKDFIQMRGNQDE